MRTWWAWPSDRSVHRKSRVINVVIVISQRDTVPANGHGQSDTDKIAVTVGPAKEAIFRAVLFPVFIQLTALHDHIGARLTSLIDAGL